MVTIPNVKLSNGVEMPQFGFGVFQIPDLKECEAVVSNALAVGYRLIDTAAAYQNEEAVGRAIAKSDVKREEIFVTSKLWVSDFTYERAKVGIENSLAKLGLDYIDLYLLHQPYGDVMGAWKALEEAYHDGKIRAIGVSNFYPDQLKNLELCVSVQPVLNQIEVNPWFQQEPDVAFIQQAGMRVEAWAPFAEGKHHIFSNELLMAIGEKYGKTSGQVILRWLLQRDITVIPKTVRRERMIENIDVFDFELTPADMAAIATLNKNESQFFDHRDPVAIEQIFGSSLSKLRE